MPKPSLSWTFDPANPLSLGPYYGLLEGSGAGSIDNSPAGAPALSLVGSAAWISGANGPAVRTTAAGDFLSAPDSLALERPSTAITLVLGVSLAGVAAASYPKYTNKRYGYAGCSWGFVSIGDYGNTIAGELSVGGVSYFTPEAVNSSDPANIALNQPYIAVLRWASGSHPRCQIFDRATGTLVSDKQGTQTARRTAPVSTPPSGSIDYAANPLTIGFGSNGFGESPSYCFGDYEFLGVSDRAWTDPEVAGFVANPYANFASSSAQYALAGPAGGLPGSASAPFTVTLNAGVAPAGTVTVTPSVAGMAGTFAPALVGLTNASRSASFTFTPSQSVIANAIGTISVANNGSLVNPASAPYQAVYAPPLKLPQFRAQLGLPVTGAGGFPTYAAGHLTGLNGSEHYDPIRCFQQVRDHEIREALEPHDWSGPIAAALVALRDGYFLPFAGQVQPYHAYATGTARDYFETGGLASRDAVLTLDPVITGQLGPAYNRYYGGQGASRECAFAILNHLEAEWLGRAHSADVEDKVAYSLGHVAQWTRPDGQRYWATWVRPFMVALTSEALIAYWERFRRSPSTAVATHDGRSQADLVAAIPAAVKGAIDWIWDHCWYPAGTVNDLVGAPLDWSNGSFAYTDIDLNDGIHLAAIATSTVGAGSASSFSGPSSLSAQDDYFKFAYAVFAAGPWAGYLIPIAGYAGASRTFTPAPPYDATFAAGPGDGVGFTLYPDANQGGAVNTGGVADSPDLNHLIAPAFAWYYWYATSHLGVRDNGERVRHEAIFNGGTMCWGPATAQKQWNQATRWGLAGLDWRSRGDAAWAAPTAYTLTAPGPASGQARMPSGAFRLAVPGSRAVTDPVTVTPASGTGRGSFVPASAVLTNHRPSALFRFIPDPLDAGSSVTITVTNDGGLADPPAVPYAVTTVAPVATGYAVSGPSGGPVGSPASFTLATVPADAALPVADLRAGGGIVPFTPFDGYDGNEFSLAAYPGQTHLVWISPESPSQSFRFTPTAAGARSLSFVATAASATVPSTTFDAVATATFHASSLTTTFTLGYGVY